jgi:CRISPR/Cas system-associated exonuclease Cas4 (RecB family)
MIYEQCPMRFKLSKIDRLPEPPRPPNNPLERGNRIHKNLELFVKGEQELRFNEANKIDAFIPVLEHAQKLYNDGFASVEENWWFDTTWDVCDRDTVWLWSKLDLNVTDKVNALSIVTDYKSGKSAYKAIDHIQQGQLYAAATALRQEWAEKIIVEFWYVDEGHIKSMEYTREQALMFVGRFDMRARHIFDDTHYRPNPNRVTCHWCPYSPRGTGACPVGV